MYFFNCQKIKKCIKWKYLCHISFTRDNCSECSGYFSKFFLFTHSLYSSACFVPGRVLTALQVLIPTYMLISGAKVWDFRYWPVSVNPGCKIPETCTGAQVLPCSPGLLPLGVDSQGWAEVQGEQSQHPPQPLPGLQETKQSHVLSFRSPISGASFQAVRLSSHGE